MKQLFQDLRTGQVEGREIPCPSPGSGQVLIRTTATLVSPGTERMLAEFGKAGWIKKALQQPDKVKQVIQKIKTDGLGPAVQSVFSKLSEPLPLGYCSTGVVLEVGSRVTAFKPGDRVISNGPHAEVVCVGEKLCAKVPDGVPDEAAAFTVLSAIALHGIRLSEVRLGESAAVMGLGLVGLLACQCLRAAGVRVLGFDLDDSRVALARGFGAEAFCLSGEVDPIQTALSFSDGFGVDAVLITAATKSNEPISQAPRMCRKRGKVVLVGVVGLELSRNDFYHKEVSFQVSCSYGPGRYESAYEEKGMDYPIGYVRWTEARNFGAVLELMRDGKLRVDGLVTHRVPFGEIEARYGDLLEDRSALGNLIEYPKRKEALERTVWTGAAEVKAVDRPVIGVIGAGNFARAVLVPAFRDAGAVLRGVAGRSGGGAGALARKFGFEYCTSDYEKIFGDDKINAVVIATRHNSHAELAIRGLEAGKHVFVEKPLGITEEEVRRVGEVWERRRDLVLMVGFNRRFSPFAVKMKELLEGRADPLAMVMTVNAGSVPADSWLLDPEVGGGRIVGEGCHFVDLMQFLAGSEVVDHRVRRAGKAEDIATIELGFRDGSIGSVHYFANGHKDVAKERLEVFCGGRVLAVDNWRVLRGFGFKGFGVWKLRRQDKGHREEVRRFCEGVMGKVDTAAHRDMSDSP